MARDALGNSSKRLSRNTWGPNAAIRSTLALQSKSSDISTGTVRAEAGPPSNTAIFWATPSSRTSMSSARRFWMGWPLFWRSWKPTTARVVSARKVGHESQIFPELVRLTGKIAALGEDQAQQAPGLGKLLVRVQSFRFPGALLGR